MSETDTQLPGQKELEKEIGDYLTRKYGQKVKIVSAGLLPHAKSDEEKKTTTAQTSVPFDFDLKPEELINYLDEYIVQQDKAKAVLATKICTHFNRIRYASQYNRKTRSAVGKIKNNVLLIGPTGVGKTFMVKLIAEKIGVPFIKGDATKFSETGYVGGDVDDLVRDLVREADNDIEKAQFGIIYVDEIDKIAHAQNRHGLDVSRSGVQRALLKPMEETEVELKVPHDMISQIEAMEQFRKSGKRERKTINTQNILFVMSGAFNGLDELIHGRIHKKTIGFEGDLAGSKQPQDVLKKVTSEDLVSYGFESEFIGRLPITAVLDFLTKDDLTQILRNPNCAIVNSKKEDFLVYGIKLIFDDSVYSVIAELALSSNTGARGLVGVVEDILLPFEKKLPSTNITHLVVNQAVVDAPEVQLQKLIEYDSEKEQHCLTYKKIVKKQKGSLIQFLADKKSEFFRKSKVKINKKRLDLIAQEILEDNSEPDTICESFVSLVHHIQSWEEMLSDHCQLNIAFADSAVDFILKNHPFELSAIDTVCETVLKEIEYGAKLLKQKKHTQKILITDKGIRNPEKFINDLVEKIFKL